MAINRRRLEDTRRMQLRSGRIIRMTDEVSNVNGGLSTTDSAPVIVQPSDDTSRLEVSGFGPSIRFGGASGIHNVQIPQPHTEYSRDVNVGSTSNASNSRVEFRQYVEESYHDLVNLLTQQMTTILNPMMADHEMKFDRLARQVELIARIVDDDEGERQDTRGNNEGFEILFQNKNDAFRNRENPQLISRGQNADDVLARLRANQSSDEEFNLEAKVDLAELRKGPPYVCSLLKKIPNSEKSNDLKQKSRKRYSFDILKSDQIFYKLKDRDISLCPRCNAIFDAESATTFEKQRIRKELAHREEQARQKHPIRRMEGQSSNGSQRNIVATISRSQALGVQWIRNCQEFQNRDAYYKRNPQWGHRGPPRGRYPYIRGHARGCQRGKGRKG
ncbi:hypothetical protein Ahy_B10g102508 [Arachis hypogaea]|uniref:Uncharacterized protein n=1 Tax=Arachis hypogaea TaxID=3818 RepID=A0A444X2A8_ARAHY|nr:hypothetical protein Ahy_B10g102508 [Arachis hypogaea]